MVIMIAAVQEKYGPPDIIEIKEIEPPMIADDEMLVKVHASSINVADTFERSGGLIVRLAGGFWKPNQLVPGSDVAGEIVKIGKDITKFDVGDKVFGVARTGTSAEYAKVSELGVVKRPMKMSCIEAAGVPLAGLTALQYLRDLSNIQDSQTILVNGASGGVGTYGLQYVKTFDVEVTAVCSGKNEELVRELGADHFIDYTKDDITRLGQKYDVVFDAVGKIPLTRWKNLLKEEGVFLNAGNPKMNLILLGLILFWNRFRKKKMKFLITKTRRGDLEFLANLIEEGKIKTVIDQTFPLERIVDAHRYHEKGHTAGKVIINVEGETTG